MLEAMNAWYGGGVGGGKKVGKQSRFRSLKLGSGFSLYEGSKGMFTFLEGKVRIAGTGLKKGRIGVSGGVVGRCLRLKYEGE